MRYTLWQRGVLIGETDFELGKLAGSRAGVFHPAASGMTVLPAITSMAPALLGLGHALERLPLSEEATDPDVDAAIDSLENSPEGRRVLAAAQQMVDLELRDAAGKEVACESILVTDLEELSAIGIEHRVLGKPQPRNGQEPVRYVISATLRTTKAFRPAQRLH